MSGINAYVRVRDGEVTIEVHPGGAITTLPVKNGAVNVLDVIAPAIATALEAAGLKLAPFRWPVPAKPAKKPAT